MQSGIFIEVLVLQSERLVRILVNPLILFQTAPGGVFTVQQQIAMDVVHLTRCADLVAVEVVGFLAACSVFVDRVSLGETACMRATYTLHQDWRFRTGYDLLKLIILTIIFISKIFS